MNGSPLEAISALVVSLVLIATMVYSVVADEDHDHSRKSTQAYSLSAPLQTDSNDRGK